MLRKITVSLFVLYTIISIGMSGYESISKVGAIAGLACAVLCLFCIERYRLWLKLVLSMAFFFSVSWLWSGSNEVSVILNMISALTGAISAAILLELRWLTPQWLLRILLLPGLINFTGYFLGVNLTESLYDLDFDSAIKRFGGFVGHPSILIPRVFLPLFLFILIFPDLIKKNRIEFLLALFVATFCVYATGSKKAIVLSAICFFMAIFYISLQSRSRVSYFSLTFLLFFPLLGMLGNVDFSDMESYKRLVDSFDPYDESTAERKYFIDYALNYWWDYPFFGHGLDHFTYLFHKYSHNNFVEILFSFGLFGFAMYYMPLIVALNAFKEERGSVALLVFASLIFIFLDFTGVSFLERGCQIIYVIFLSHFLFEKDKYENSSIDR